MKYNVLGNRIPYEYFITSGKGESDAGSAGLPYETGSYDAALNDAQHSIPHQFAAVLDVIDTAFTATDWSSVIDDNKNLMDSVAPTGYR